MDEAPLIRKRLRRREIEGDCRFITFSCYRRWPLMGSAAIRSAVASQIALVHDRDRSFELYSWVVMPEHVHLLIRPTGGTPWARIALAIKVSTARLIVGRWRALNAGVLSRLRTPDGRYRFWQRGGGFDRNVRTTAELRRFIRYIHRNPVEAGLVARAHEWTWSSVRWWMGVCPGEVACDRPPGRVDWDTWTGFV